MFSNKIDNILIELPTWLGDTVMATPAIESILDNFKDAKVTVVGSYVSTEILRANPRIDRVVVDKTKLKGFRPLNIYRLAKELGSFDLAISFRSHISSKALLSLTKSRLKYIYKKQNPPEDKSHQVWRYQEFVNRALNIDKTPTDLKIYYERYNFNRPSLGLNPGASYGSAKRWYPSEFAKVAIALSSKFDIYIFGSSGEIDIAKDIESLIKKEGVKNVINLAGKTSIKELCSFIGGLELFITGDSGPMHIASAYKVPTVAIFGPTKYKETSQWQNPKSAIVSLNLECAPCMKRECPLKHHKCMRDIKASDVLRAVEGLGLRA